jgi:hypothetical protein
MLLTDFSETVRQNGQTSQVDAFRVQTYITDMFTACEDGADRTTVRFRTRCDWMDFLGAAYKVYFNPVLPKHSGKFRLNFNHSCQNIFLRQRHGTD